MTQSYTFGTVTVAQGSTTVTGDGTGWLTANVAPGYFGLDSAGSIPVPVAAVVSDTELTLVTPWRGEAASGSPYWLSYDTRDGQQTVNNAQRLAEYIARLDSQSLAAIAALEPEDQTIILFTGSTSAVLLPIGQVGGLFDVQVPNLAARAAYDARQQGFRVLVSDTGDGIAAIYTKLSDTPGDWSTPAFITGPKGDTGATGPFTQIQGGTTTTLPAGSQATATVRTVSPGVVALDLGLPRGLDGTGIGDMLTSVYDPTNQNRDIFADLNNRVSFASAQAKSAQQRGQARANIGAELMSGFREKVINGHFQFWQRATSQAASGYGSADRYNIFGGGTWSFSRVANAASAFPGAGEYNGFLNVTAGAPSGNTPTVQQRIEGIRQFDGETVTFRTWVFPTVAFTIEVALFSVYGTGGSAVDSIAPKTQALTPNQWNQVVLTFAVPPQAGKTISATDSCLQFQIRTPSQLAFGAYFGSISLVIGDTTAETTMPPKRHPQQEWALCQRYYERGAAQLYISGISAQWGFTYPFKVTKRAIPSMLYTDPPGGGVAPPTETSSVTAEFFRFFRGTNGPEFNFSWAANAEL